VYSVVAHGVTHTRQPGCAQLPAPAHDDASVKLVLFLHNKESDGPDVPRPSHAQIIAVSKWMWSRERASLLADTYNNSDNISILKVFMMIICK
jgi:hypothetical protein